MVELILVEKHLRTTILPIFQRQATQNAGPRRRAEHERLSFPLPMDVLVSNWAIFQFRAVAVFARIVHFRRRELSA
jgi:hypothetical protein